MTDAGPVRVMLVEDPADFRRLPAAWVVREDDMEMVAQAGSLEEASRHLASAGCDVDVLDMGLLVNEEKKRILKNNLHWRSA